MTVDVDAIDTWVEVAVQRAEFQPLDDGRVFARVPDCVGAVATGATESEALSVLRGVLHDWALVGLQAGDEIPVIDGIDLNADVVEAGALTPEERIEHAEARYARWRSVPRLEPRGDIAGAIRADLDDLERGRKSGTIRSIR